MDKSHSIQKGKKTTCSAMMILSRQEQQMAIILFTLNFSATSQAASREYRTTPSESPVFIHKQSHSTDEHRQSGAAPFESSDISNPWKRNRAFLHAFITGDCRICWQCSHKGTIADCSIYSYQHHRKLLEKGK